MRRNEDALISQIRRALRRHSGNRSVCLAIGDDAALWRPRPGYETVLTCDWFLEGTHFLLGRHPPDSVGWKCLARAVSDLAAMGAEARCFLLSLALPASQTGKWLTGFLRGLRAASRKFDCSAAGGDTTRRDDVLISVTVIGECRPGRAVLRSGAKPGDAIFVSGHLGEAEYGLRLIQTGKRRINLRDRCLRKHLYPEPRLALGTWLAERRLATAMMDLSDGLSSDLPRLCQASGVGARIETDRLPRVHISPRDASTVDALSLALNGGDDYELLFTVAPQNVRRINRRITGVPISLIGRISREQTIVAEHNGETLPLKNSGWDPFRT